MSTSIGTKVRQIATSLVGTGDLTEWEAEFVKSIAERTALGRDTSLLTEKQIGRIEAIWSRHFA